MTQTVHSRIRSNPKFQELCAKRSRFAWTLAGTMLAVYYAFVLTIAFAPKALGTPLGEGVVTTVGIPVGIAIIVFAFILTGVYVRRANGEFDELNKQILEEVK